MLFRSPKPPKVDPEVLPPPKRLPVELAPNGFEPKVVVLLLLPKPPAKIMLVDVQQNNNAQKIKLGGWQDPLARQNTRETKRSCRKFKVISKVVKPVK